LFGDQAKWPAREHRDTACEDAVGPQVPRLRTRVFGEAAHIPDALIQLQRSIRSTFAETTRAPGLRRERFFSLAEISHGRRFSSGVAISQERIFKIVHAHEDDSTCRKR